jgi:hypothetical protein
MPDAQRKSRDPSPEADSARVFGGRTAEEALDSPSKVRCAYTRLAMAVLDRVIDTTVANSTAFQIAGAAKALELEFVEKALLKAATLRHQREQRSTSMALVVDGELMPRGGRQEVTP